MSYETQAALETDPDFQRRNRAAITQEASRLLGDENTMPQDEAAAEAVLRNDPGPAQAFIRLAAAGPGIADKVDTGDGIDQSLVTDADLLSLTQANWPTVAALYFDDAGAPLP